MRTVLLFCLAVVCGLVLFVNPDEALARMKFGKRSYGEKFTDGALNRRNGGREYMYQVHAPKKSKGLMVEGMDRWGLSELPVFGGRAPRPNVIQPDLEGRTGRTGRRGRGVSYEDEREYSDSCSFSR